MPSPIVQADVSSLIIEYTQNVLSVMLGLSVAPRSMGIYEDPNGPTGDVIALVGFVGQWTGIGTVSCSADLARKIGQKMLLAEFDDVNEEVLDAIGEISNMIIGNLKDGLEPVLGPLGLGTPTVLLGDPVKARSLNAKYWTTVSFDCLGETLDVKVSLRQSNQEKIK